MAFDLKIEYRINDLSSADHYDQKKNLQGVGVSLFLLFLLYMNSDLI